MSFRLIFLIKLIFLDSLTFIICYDTLNILILNLLNLLVVPTLNDQELKSLFKKKKKLT